MLPAGPKGPAAVGHTLDWPRSYMEVDDVVDLGGGHTIEFGRATWNRDDRSVRNRYPTSTGGFSPRSSSEIPVHDFEPLIVESARRDVFSVDAAERMIAALSNSIGRQRSR